MDVYSCIFARIHSILEYVTFRSLKEMGFSTFNI